MEMILTPGHDNYKKWNSRVNETDQMSLKFMSIITFDQTQQSPRPTLYHKNSLINHCKVRDIR